MSDHDKYEQRTHSEAMQQRSQNFQREQTRQKQFEADEKEHRNNENKTAVTINRQEHQKDMYEHRRSDQLADKQAQMAGTLEAEQEKTHRSKVEIEAGVDAYGKKLDLDYEHDVRTRNLDMQEYQKKTEFDTDSHKDRTRSEGLQKMAEMAQESRHLSTEIKTRLQGTLIEKIADHILAKDFATHTAPLNGSPAPGGQVLTPEQLEDIRLQTLSPAPSNQPQKPTQDKPREKTQNDDEELTNEQKFVKGH